ncbi:MAG: tRNA pseudouridine(13) synthase TruD [Pseudomonadales bacterium]|nr:tRNA pseudouridine(13) synthase TruD [Pseudomonadales bacterium]MCP5331101.1 tRNA pseudouridine(13) synthase TruD [Pseudomonadales bacterium]MCP5343564.1 tRNA pseudouridine(13) synthase TruD [Pseudomonadales bacterium]
MSAAREAQHSLAYASGRPACSAVFKHSPEDFQVTEDLGFELTGDGEHCCVQVCKRGLSTQEVVRHLSRLAGVREHDVGYAGLKDRQGLCTQWFSVYMPGRSLEADTLSAPGIEVVTLTRNSRKLRRGSHRSNGFRIVLRELAGTTPQALEQALHTVAAMGVPNYFGEQRFGLENRNVDEARRLFSGALRLRKGYRRGMLISSARSFVFNQILSRRVLEGNWNAYLDGDVMNLDGSGSVFTPAEWDATLQERLREFDIHPTGALWGRGELPTHAEAGALERDIAQQHPDLCQGLENMGLRQERRSLRLPVRELQWQFLDGKTLELGFALPPGSYATTVLREICCVKEADGEEVR